MNKEIKKSSIELDDNSYFDIEQVIKKVASENGIENVNGVTVDITKESAIVKFKVAEEEQEEDDDEESSTSEE
jgi:hypothetical protein